MNKTVTCRWCKKPFAASKLGGQKSCKACAKKWKSIYNYEWRMKNPDYHKKWRKDLKNEISNHHTNNTVQLYKPSKVS